jgi:alcohol dehydrogenase
MPGKKAMIVISKGKSTRENGYLARVEEQLKLAGVETVVFDKVEPNPLKTTVMAGAAFAKENGCDFIVALGGGSPIDASKAIAIIATNPGDIWDYVQSGTGKRKAIENKPLPIVAITTTAGTGSETDMGAVITNEETHEKVGIKDLALFPVFAIVDPELMLSVPKKITAATGFDVLAHSIEAYTSNCATPITDKMAEEAIRIVGKYLRRAVENGNDIEARTELAYADTLAGFSIATAGITLCHSISHAVGGVCETVHGESLAAMTPHTMRFSMDSRPEKYKNIGLFLRDEMCCEENDGCCSCENSVQEVEKLINDIGMNIPLSKQGVKESDFDEIATGTTKYMGGGLEQDPKRSSKEDIIEILKKSF